MAKTFEDYQKYIFNYGNLKLLFKKLEVMVERCTSNIRKRDALLVNEGAEGDGKTNASVLEAGFIKALTGREIHLFFRLKEMMEFAQKTEGKIIIWDEPALDSLSSDAISTLNKDMLRLFMSIRIKRHFFIVNYTKFWKFPEYITSERALGMFRVYSRKEIEMGRFLYIKKGNLERLRQDYDKNKKKNYRKYASFHGVFPEVMEEYFDCLDISVNGRAHATLNDYEDEKVKAIGLIGVKASGMSKKELALWKQVNGLRYRFSMIRDITRDKLCATIGLEPRRIQEWAKIPLESTDLLGKPRFEAAKEAINTSLEVSEPENEQD